MGILNSVSYYASQFSDRLRRLYNQVPITSLPTRKDPEAKRYLKHEKLRSYLSAYGNIARFLPLLDSYTKETAEIREMYRVMMRDPYVKASVLTKMMAVASLDLQANPADKNVPLDKDGAEWVQYALDHHEGGTEQLIYNILYHGLIDGFSVCEPVWDIVRRGKYKQRLYCRTLKPKDSKHLVLEGDVYRNITGVQDLRGGGAVWHPDNFVIWSHLPMFASPTGMSDFRAAYRAFWLIDTAWRLRAIAMERYGLPIMKATYQTTEQQMELEQTLDDLRSQSWITLPQEVQLEAMSVATGNNQEFKTAIDDLREELVTGIVGATLQMLQGDVSDGRGSSAVHKGTAELIQWYLRSQMQAVIYNQLVPKLIEFNLPGADYPTISLGSINDADLAATLQVDQGLQQLGWIHSKEEIQEKYGRRLPKDKNDELQPQQQQGMMGGGFPGMPPPGGDDQGGGFPPDGGGDDQGGGGGDQDLAQLLATGKFSEEQEDAILRFAEKKRKMWRSPEKINGKYRYSKTQKRGWLPPNNEHAPQGIKPSSAEGEEETSLQRIQQETRQKRKADVDRVGSDKKELRKELQSAKSVLADWAREKFGKGRFDLPNKRFVSDDGQYALQWLPDTTTNRGSVQFVKVESSQNTPSQANSSQKPKRSITPESVEQSLSRIADGTGSASIADLRKAMGNPENFDQLLYKMASDRQIFLAVDNHAALATPAERAKMLKIGDNYYIEATLANFDNSFASKQQSSQKPDTPSQAKSNKTPQQGQESGQRGTQRVEYWKQPSGGQLAVDVKPGNAAMKYKTKHKQTTKWDAEGYPIQSQIITADSKKELLHKLAVLDQQNPNKAKPSPSLDDYRKKRDSLAPVDLDANEDLPPEQPEQPKQKPAKPVPAEVSSTNDLIAKVKAGKAKRQDIVRHVLGMGGGTSAGKYKKMVANITGNKPKTADEADEILHRHIAEQAGKPEMFAEQLPEFAWRPDSPNEWSKPRESSPPVKKKLIAEPANEDFDAAERLLQRSVNYGTQVLKALLARAIQRDTQNVQFTQKERQAFAAAMARVIAPANLLGQYRTRKLADYAQRETTKFHDRPVLTFAEPVPPMGPKNALEYFRSLIPSWNPEPTWADSVKQRAWSMAVTSEQTILDKVRKIIDQTISRGDVDRSLPVWQIELVLDQAGVTPKNPQYAEMVFRTNMMQAYTQGSQQAMRDPKVEDIFPVWQYVGIRDGRQGKDHEEKFGLYFKSDIDFDQVRGPRVFNCVLPGNRISGRINGASKARYSGEAVEIHSSRGCKFTVTGNHPILTNRGFVPAKSITVADKIIGDFSDIKRSVFSVDEQQYVPLIEDVFHAFSVVESESHITPVSGLDFHGDGRFCDKEVHIVRPNWELLHDWYLKLSQISSDSILFGRNLSSGHKPGLSAAALNLPGVLLPPSGCVSSSNLRFAGRANYMTPFDSFGFRLSSQSDTSCLQSEINNRTTDTKFIGKLICRLASQISIDNFVDPTGYRGSGHCGFGTSSRFDTILLEPAGNSLTLDTEFSTKMCCRFPGQVLPDNVVHVNVFHYDGPVYDLETDVGYYTIGLGRSRVFCSNCRCNPTPVSKYKWKRLQQNGAKIAF